MRRIILAWCVTFPFCALLAFLAAVAANRLYGRAAAVYLPACSEDACHGAAKQSHNCSMNGAMEYARQVGAMPVRRAPDGTLLVLLVTTLQTQRWVIPKGWPWPGERDHTSAAAEAREEAGVLGEARPGSIGSYTYEKRRPSGPVPVRVMVYLLDVQEELDTWPECERRQRAWFTPGDAADAVEEPELRQLLLQLKATAEGAL